MKRLEWRWNLSKGQKSSDKRLDQPDVWTRGDDVEMLVSHVWRKKDGRVVRQREVSETRKLEGLRKKARLFRIGKDYDPDVAKERVIEEGVDEKILPAVGPPPLKERRGLAPVKVAVTHVPLVDVKGDIHKNWFRLGSQAHACSLDPLMTHRGKNQFCDHCQRGLMQRVP